MDMDMDTEETLTAAELENLRCDFDFDDHNEPHPIHPLLIPNVVRDILKYLPLEEVEKCRGVCNLWNGEACRIIEKEAVITFTDSAEITTYMKYFASSTREASTYDKPYHSSYQMYLSGFTRNNTILEQFLTVHGNHIKKLILQCNAVTEEDFYWALETHLTNVETIWLRYIPGQMSHEEWGTTSHNQHDFPSVKHLIVGTLSFGHFGTRGPFVVADDDDDVDEARVLVVGRSSKKKSVQTSMVELLSSFSNLQSLTCSSLDQPCNTFIATNILKCLVKVPNSKLRHLVNINFPLYPTERLLHHLNILCLCNLSQVDITLDADEEVSTVRTFFHIVARNLQKLTLNLPIEFSYSRYISLPGHEMSQLRHLTLNRYRWSLEFLKNLSSLDCLELVDMPIALIFPISFKHEHNLRSLKIEENDSNFDSEVMSRITRAYPRLEVLKISGADDDCLRVIYRGLPYLTDLACVGGVFTDCGVTGVALEVCNDLIETMTYPLVNPVTYRQDLFIGNLTNLTHLLLESEEMTHLSVLFGIVKCELKHLHLKSSKFSDAAVESIVDNMISSLKILNVINCPGITGTGKSYAQHRIPELKAYVHGEQAENMQDVELTHIQAQADHVRFDMRARSRTEERPITDMDAERFELRHGIGIGFFHRARGRGAARFNPIVADQEPAPILNLIYAAEVDPDEQHEEAVLPDVSPMDVIDSNDEILISETTHWWEKLGWFRYFFGWSKIKLGAFVRSIAFND